MIGTCQEHDSFVTLNMVATGEVNCGRAQCIPDIGSAPAAGAYVSSLFEQWTESPSRMYVVYAGCLDHGFGAIRQRVASLRL